MFAYELACGSLKRPDASKNLGN